MPRIEQLVTYPISRSLEGGLVFGIKLAVVRAGTLTVGDAVTVRER